MTAVYGVVIALVVVVFLLGLLVVGLLRSNGEILRRLESLGAGMSPEHDDGSQIRLRSRDPDTATVAQPIQGITTRGESVIISPTSGDDPLLLAFLSTSCASCTEFWERIDSPTLRFGTTRHRVLIVTRSENEESPTRASSLTRGTADVVMSSSAWADFGVPGAPYFVVLDPGTGVVVGEGSAPTYEALDEFLTDSSNDRLWDRGRLSVRDDESRVDAELRDAGLLPGDPRLFHQRGELHLEDED